MLLLSEFICTRFGGVYYTLKFKTQVSQRIAMKTLAVAKQHRMNHHMGAIENGNEKLIDDD